LREHVPLAFDWAFAMGCRRVVLAGSDIFDLQAAELEAALLLVPKLQLGNTTVQKLQLR
jgi:hypothetical protein